MITGHEDKPLFGLRALQRSVGKTVAKIPVYEEMPEPPKVKKLVLKHDKPKDNSKPQTPLRQKPKAKFRDSFLLNTNDEGSLYHTFGRNGFTELDSITLRSTIENPKDDRNNVKSQSKIVQLKSVMRSDGSRNVSVTQNFLKGKVENDQTPSGKLTTRRRNTSTAHGPGDSDAKKVIGKMTATIDKHCAVPKINEITDEFNNSDRIDGYGTVKRSRPTTNDKFESIRERFNNQKSTDRDSRRSSKETNGYGTAEESLQSVPGSSVLRGDLIKGLQHKFQQANVSFGLKRNRSIKSTADSSSSTGRIEKRTVKTAKLQDTSKYSGAIAFLDNKSRVAVVKDILTRNAGLACANVVDLANTDDEVSQPMRSLSLKTNAAARDDSGEDVNQKTLVQVRGVLADLESALPALDPLGRSSVIELLAKLQTSLKPSVAYELRPFEAKTACRDNLQALSRQTGEYETASNPLTGKLQEDRGDRIEKTTSEKGLATAFAQKPNKNVVAKTFWNDGICECPSNDDKTGYDRSKKATTSFKPMRVTAVQMPLATSSSKLQKSESWHRMSQSKMAVRTPFSGGGRLAASYKRYSPRDQLDRKRDTVRQHPLRSSGSSAKKPVVKPDEDTVEDEFETMYKEATVTDNMDDIEKMEDTFESMFKEATVNDNIDDIEKMEDAFESLFTEAMKSGKK